VSKNNIEIIVVDNGSTDGTLEMIRKKHKTARVLAQKTNVGVARGYNIGMENSKGEYILIINSDTYIEKDTLSKCLSYLEKNKQCDVVMARLTTLEGEFKPYGGFLPTPLRTIRWLLGFESIPFLKNHINKIYQYEAKHYINANIIEWAPTCFYFMRSEVFKKTKGHDEKMFLYMENIEWSKRIYDAGMRIWFVPTIGSIHIGGESTRKKLPSIFLLRRQLEGAKYYHKKHFPRSFLLINLFLYLGFSARSLAYISTGKKEKGLNYFKALLH
jgi:GT2 family glycosyltransferase